MLSCSDYDFIEIACLYQFDVELYYADRVIRGIAKDTGRDANGEESMLIEVQQSKQDEWLPLNALLSIKAYTPNRFFSQLEFSH